jgi:spore coat polysaccharide biosynthesis protein SpsF
MASERKRVLIGIQARSTSSRFPRKVFEKIGKQTMLQHVIVHCKRAVEYLNTAVRTPVDAQIVLLVPVGDEIVKLSERLDVEVMEGPESDVLTRYTAAAQAKQADFIVRITADCPLIPPFLISKHVLLAIEKGYDYVSNVFEESRTAPDGFDCEVLSSKALAYLDRYAVTSEYREHVTLMMRREPPKDARIGCVVSFLDLADVKLSVDTPEDLERVRAQYARVQQCNQEAHERFGRFNVHRV